MTQCGLCQGCTDVPFKCVNEPCLPGLSGTGGPLGNGAVLDSSSSYTWATLNFGINNVSTTYGNGVYGNQNTNAHYVGSLLDVATVPVNPATICQTLAQGAYVCDGCSLGTCSNGVFITLPCSLGTFCQGGFCVAGTCPIA